MFVQLEINLEKKVYDKKFLLKLTILDFKIKIWYKINQI